MINSMHYLLLPVMKNILLILNKDYPVTYPEKEKIKRKVGKYFTYIPIKSYSYKRTFL